MTDVSITDYWMGRDKSHASDMTAAIEHNTTELLIRVNTLLDWMAEDSVTPGIDEVTGTYVASGWRPPGVNARTKNAAKGSKHQSGQAVDLQDTPDRDLVRWCLKNLDALHEVGLWMENPQWTPDWLHLQMVPPGSGKRVYIPSTAPPLVAALPEQHGLA